MRVGVVEDNADLRAELAFHLQRAGLEVALQGDGTQIDAQLAATPCDLLVLDLGLPAEDGLQIAHRLREQRRDLGIVVLTARASLNDRLRGLQEGADAYLVKPVDMRELVATLHTVYRRLPQADAAATASAWLLFPRTLSVQAPAGQQAIVTPVEMALLRCLVGAAPEPVSRERLAEAAGHPEPSYDDRRLEVIFSRLRRKIEPIHRGESPIRSARGQGYVFASPARIVKT